MALPALALGVAALLPAAGLDAAPAKPRAAPTAPWLEEPFPSTYAPRARHDVLIAHATVLDGAGGRLDDGDVLLQNGRVVALGHGLKAPPGAETVDAHGRWVTPGLIDVHSHDGTYVLPLTDIDEDSSDVSELETPNSANIRIENAINPQDAAFQRALENGVTTLQVLPGSTPIFSGQAVVLKPLIAPSVAAMKFPAAPSGFKMACGENPKSFDAEQKRGPTSRAGEIAYIRQAFLDAQRYREEWRAWAAGRTAEPPRRDLKMEALVNILEGRLRINMHCYRSDEMANMLAVAQEFGFHLTAFHHATEAYKIPGLLRAAGTCAAVWGDWWGFKMEALDGIRANAPLLDKAGVCVTMHSDSPVSGQRLAIDAATAAAAGRAVGIALPPERLIRWVTGNSAHMLGLEDRIGRLAPGYNADVVVWSGNPFSIYTKADLVLIDGALVFDRAHPPAHAPSDFELGREGVPLP
ncbi:MAG TPA: amidohydrolase family protein [Novosphingobium sp.]|nr:amidohydrolase family protein [Novosphingobium sp.]